MEVSKTLENFTAKQRLTIIIGIGIIAIIITIFLIHSEDEDKPIISNNTIQNVVKNSNKVVMAIEQQGNEVGQPVRDPFTIPPNITTHVENQIGNKPPSISNTDTTKSIEMPTTVKPKELVKLTGIVITDYQRLAVIHTTNKSKAYQINDFIGAYQLTSIQESFVILKDNDGQLILSLESKNNGGNN